MDDEEKGSVHKKDRNIQVSLTIYSAKRQKETI